MRTPATLGLICLLATAARAEGPAIPQDHARMEKQSRDRLAWNRETLVGAYDRVGKRDPRWDKPAREAMDMAARMFSLQVDPQVTFIDVQKPARAAVEAGCDDPMVVYLYRRTFMGSKYPNGEGRIPAFKAAAEALAASRYPAFRRGITLGLAAGDAADAFKRAEPGEPADALKAEARRLYAAAFELFRESDRTDDRNEFWEDRWFDALKKAHNGFVALGDDEIKALEKIEAVLAKCPKSKVLQLQLRGEVWYSYGWKGRTNALAPDVPAGGFERFEERLVKARKAYDEAWKLRPGDARTAARRVEIEKGIGGGDRAAMELWFERAMKADGNDFGACYSKLDWLDPKWYGSAEDLLDFGRACRETKNWKAAITLLAADAHFRVSCMYDRETMGKYLGQPEVFREIESVYEEYLRHFPDDDDRRSKYAMLLSLSGHFREAHAQFERLGDRLSTWWDTPNFTLDAMKDYRAWVAKLVAKADAAGGGNRADRGR